MQQFISNYGYLAIFILMLAESACIPVPSELTMLFAGALSAGAVAGVHLNLVLAIAAGVAGNVAGQLPGLGHRNLRGPGGLAPLGALHPARDDDIDRAERWFGRHGGKAVFFGRLLPVVRTFISLPAGLARMPAGRFGLYTVLGCIPWTAALACTGYLVGKNWGNVVSALHGPSYALAALCGLLVIFAIVMLLRRRRRERDRPSGHAAPGGHSEPGEHGTRAERTGLHR